MDRKIIIGLSFGLLVITLGIAFSVFNISDKSQYLITMGTSIFVAIIMIALVRGKNPVYDERDKKIGKASIALSWTVSYLMIAVLIWVDMFKLIVFSVQQVLSLVFFFMAAVQLFARFYYARKGDTE